MLIESAGKTSHEFAQLFRSMCYQASMIDHLAPGAELLSGVAKAAPDLGQNHEIKIGQKSSGIGVALSLKSATLDR